MKKDDVSVSTQEESRLGESIGSGDIAALESEGWKFCEEVPCEFMVCGWTGIPFCFPHSMDRLGEAEMKRRYEATHSISWAEFLKDE